MDDLDPAWTIDELSDGQKIVRFVVELCSASLSVIGSSLIVFKILRDLPRTPYDRIMLGLSCCDFIASIGWAMNDFLMPSEKSLNLWAFGNSATCNASGFWTQISGSAIWYNCLLSYYFLFTVLSQVKRKNLVRKFEPWMHLSVTFFPITAVIGLYRGWYSESMKGCQITDPKPKWIFQGFPYFFTYISLIINYSVIYAVVRKALRSSEHVAGSLTPGQKRLKRESTIQMFLYVGSFFLSNSPALIMTILDVYFDYTVGKLYPVLVLDALLWPLQGFFNFLIYIKPMYTRFRAAYPDKPMFFVLHQAMSNSKAPRLHHRRVANHVTHRSDVLITDITLGEDRAMDPNQALFYPGQLPSSSDSSSNDIAEGDNERASGSIYFVLHQALFNAVPQMTSPSERSIVPGNPNQDDPEESKEED